MKKILIPGLLVSVCVAFFLSPFASTSPDGLEKVAEDKGFLQSGEEKGVVKSPIPDYTFPGVKSEAVATGIAGVAGVILVFGTAAGLGVLLKKRRIK
jgi:cobalt/nickel transport protein